MIAGLVQTQVNKRLEERLKELESISPDKVSMVARTQGEIAALRWLFSLVMEEHIESELNRRNEQ